MRITLGMNVEVWITTNAAPPMGAWRVGEVVWGNGHSYVMRWLDGGPDSDRISRKFVRPLPDPTIKLPADLVAGDFVEVLDGSLWKLAEVLGAGHGQFEVKIVGSTRVLTADQSVLRPPQVYDEKGWVVLHKGNKIHIESVVPSRPIAGKNIKSKANGNVDCKFAANAIKLGKTKKSNYAVDADIVRDVKRFQGNGDARTKFFAKKELARRYHDNVEVMDVHPSLYLKKREETSNNKYNNVECDVVGGRGTDRDSDNDSDDDSSSKSDPSSSSDGGSDGDSSGGGSSSSSSNRSNIKGGVRAVPTTEHCQENQEVLPSSNEKYQDSDDGTESRGSARMHHSPANEEEVVMVKRDHQVEEEEEEQDDRVHGLELEAYLGVMKAFHATGPLTWAKEELLSNLRLHLHVSSDEHLQAIWLLNGKKKPTGGPRYC